MPQPTGRTLETLIASIPEFGAARNPCDVTAQVKSAKPRPTKIGSVHANDIHAIGISVTIAVVGYSNGNGHSNARPGPTASYGFWPWSNAREPAHTCPRSDGCGCGSRQNIHVNSAAVTATASVSATRRKRADTFAFGRRASTAIPVQTATRTINTTDLSRR